MKMFSALVFYINFSFLITIPIFAAHSKNTNTFIPNATMEKQIPRTMAGDRGRYYLLGMEKRGNIIVSLSKRIGTDSTGYSVCEINWNKNLIRDTGYSEESVDKINYNPSK